MFIPKQVWLGGLILFVLSGCTPTNRQVPTLTSPSPAEKRQLKLDTFSAPPQATPIGSSVPFHCATSFKGTAEPTIIWAVAPDPGATVAAGSKIKLWYNDEFPMLLGAGAITKTTQHHVVNPDVGDLTQRDPDGYPWYPALFLTDVTVNPANTNLGPPHKPNEVFGTWKALGEAAPMNDMAAPYLPPEADPFPVVSNLGYGTVPFERRSGAEVVWSVDSLGLTPGHIYNAQFVIHDGDDAGDIGVGCMTIHY